MYMYFGLKSFQYSCSMSVNVMSSMQICINARNFPSFESEHILLQSPKKHIKMKTFIFFGGFLLALAIAGEDPYMSIKEFEEKFGEEFATKEDEDAAAEELAKNEAEVDLENTMYDEGEGTFKEGTQMD